MEVAYFVQQDFLTAGSLWDGDQISVYHSYQELIESRIQPLVIVLGFKDLILVQQLLYRLRANETYTFTPIYLETRVGGASTVLADGVAPSPCVAKRKAEEHNKAAQFDQFACKDQDIQLLAYPYSRNRAKLEPVSDWHAEGVYFYPLLRAFNRSSQLDDLSWLGRLLRRGLLQPAHLLDKVRFCAQCSSAHLNYLEVCPTCFGMDVSEPALHEEEQVRACNHCRQHFVESKSIARCMACHTTNQLSQLIYRSVYNYSLTEKAIKLIESSLRIREITQTVLKGLVTQKQRYQQ